MSALNLKEDFITQSGFSRPGIPSKDIRFVYLHWVANPKTNAKQNRDFFESRKQGDKGFGSGHYIVDENEVVMCIPEEEIALSVGTGNGATRWMQIKLPGATERFRGYSFPNYYGIAVELCHEDWEGSFHEDTWERAALLVADICIRYSLDPYSDVVTHNMVVGWKDCPRWFVKHPSELERFRWDVKTCIAALTSSSV